MHEVISCAKSVFNDNIAAIIEISDRHSEISMIFWAWTARRAIPVLEYTTAIP
jgi:hypothetical protein